MHTEWNAVFSSEAQWSELSNETILKLIEYRSIWKSWIFLIIFKKFSVRKLLSAFKRVSKESWVFIEFSKKKTHLKSFCCSVRKLVWSQSVFARFFSWDLTSIKSFIVIYFCLCVLNMEKQFDKVNFNDLILSHKIPDG